MITAAQAWYVARVYPERVTDAEARRDFEQEIISEAERTYWESAARVLSDMASDVTHDVPSNVPYVEVDQETAYGITTRMQRSVRVF
jgi:hypothetical protein